MNGLGMIAVAVTATPAVATGAERHAWAFARHLPLTCCEFGEDPAHYVPEHTSLLLTRLPQRVCRRW